MNELQTLRFKSLYSHGLPEVAKNALVALGAIWLFVEVLAFFFEAVDKLLRDDSTAFVACVIGSLIFASVRAFPPMRVVRRFKSRRLEIEIVVGDLLDQKSDIAVISGEFFDTDPKRIASNSIKGQIVKRMFNDDHGVLSGKIQESLQQRGIDCAEEIEDRPWNTKRYPMGSIAVVRATDKSGSEKRVYFVAATHVGEAGKTSATVSNLWNGLIALWCEARRTGDLRPLSIPVLGAGLSRVPGSPIALIQLALISFVMENALEKLTQRLTIVIHPSDYHPEQMQELKFFVDNLPD